MKRDKTIIDMQKIENKCDHYFDWGYSGELCVYCVKCNKELFQIGINESILQTHDVYKGKLVLKEK